MNKKLEHSYYRPFFSYGRTNQESNATTKVETEKEEAVEGMSSVSQVWPKSML